MTFQIAALPRSRFAPLWALTDEELARMGARSCVVTVKPGFPRRVSLEDAEETAGAVSQLPRRAQRAVRAPYRPVGRYRPPAQ